VKCKKTLTLALSGFAGEGIATQWRATVDARLFPSPIPMGEGI